MTHKFMLTPNCFFFYIYRFISSSCHCDDRCALFGDCCWDASIKYWTSATDDMDEDSNRVDSWSCLPLRTKDNAQDLDDLVHIQTKQKRRRRRKR